MKLFEFDIHIGDWRVLVQSRDIQNGAIQSRHIADGAITGDKVAEPLPIEKIQDNSIPGDKLEIDSIEGSKFADKTITGNKIADKAITSDKIADEAVEELNGLYEEMRGELEQDISHEFSEQDVSIANRFAEQTAAIEQEQASQRSLITSEFAEQDEKMDNMQATINAKQLELGAVETDSEPTPDSGNHLTSGTIAASYGHFIESPEFAEVHCDQEGKYAYGVKTNGDFDWASGIPGFLLTKIRGNGYDPIEDVEGRASICFDAENKIISYRSKEGELVERVGIKTPKLLLEDDGLDILVEQLQHKGFSPDSRKSLGILVIGSSGESSYMPYLPPVLNEVLHDYDITYGKMYSSGADAGDYVRFYENNTPCTAFDLWKPGDTRWSRYQNTYTLEMALAVYNWDFVLFKGTVANSRKLMRIIQSKTGYPVNFVTDSRYSRLYDRGSDTTKDIDDLWEQILTTQNEKVKTTGFMDTIPIGTSIQNARHNDILKKAGLTWGEPRQFTIPAGKYLLLQQKVRGESTHPTLKARRVSGTGTVTIDLGAYTVFALTDNVEQTVGFTTADTTTIKFTNSGSDECVVEFVNDDSVGDYLLYDDQHIQAGVAELLAAYTIALKVLQWTGNSHRGINASSFIPTSENLNNINAVGSHGEPCGIVDYLGSDGNHYDRSQLLDASGIYYVAETVFNGSPDANSITAVENGILYENIYAVQEIAAISVGNPNELTDCSGTIIETPQKN